MQTSSAGSRWAVALAATLLLTGSPGARRAAAAPPLNHRLDPALHAAVVAGDVPTIKRLLQRGADPNCEVDDGAGTPILNLAATIGDPVEMITALVGAGANVEALAPHGSTALATAALLGHTAAVEVLVKSGAHLETPGQDGVTALMTAAAGSQPGTTKQLLQLGANPNVTAVNGANALCLAVAKEVGATGDAEVVGALIGAGCDVSQTMNDGNTPAKLAHEASFTAAAGLLDEAQHRNTDLVRAVMTNDWPLVKTLLAQGANPHFHVRLYENEADEKGEVCTVALKLKSAALGFDPVMAQAMLAKSDLNFVDNEGRTPLLVAVDNADLPLSRLLLAAGANPNATDKASGSSALAIAAQKGNLELVRSLVEAGANPALRTPGGKFPADLAPAEIAVYLQAHTAPARQP